MPVNSPADQLFTINLGGVKRFLCRNCGL